MERRGGWFSCCKIGNVLELHDFLLAPVAEQARGGSHDRVPFSKPFRVLAELAPPVNEERQVK